MKTQELIAALAGHPLVKGMPDEHLAALSKLALPVRCGPGEYIFRRGFPASRFYLINEGRIAVGALDPEHTITQVVSAGEALGWSWLFPPYKWHFEAKALTPVEAVFIDAARLRTLCEEDHSFGYEFLKRAVETMADRRACQGCGKGPV